MRTNSTLPRREQGIIPKPTQSHEPDPEPSGGPLAPFAHLGVWSALYVASSIATLTTLASLTVGPASYAFAFLTALSTYLLDRVKLRDRDFDPSDAIAHPERAAFVRRHRRLCRAVVLASALGAVGVAFAINPLASCLVPGSLVGVLVYARSKRRWAWRPKDVLALKNPSVACAITVFAVVIVLLSAHAPFVETLRRLALPAIFLAMHVLADAMLCDVDDMTADDRYGTRTVPVSVGRKAGVRLAISLKLLASAWAAGLIVFTASPTSVAIVWAVAPIVLAISMVFGWRGRYRDPVDLSLPLVAAIALLVEGLL